MSAALAALRSWRHQAPRHLRNNRSNLKAASLKNRTPVA